MSDMVTAVSSAFRGRAAVFLSAASLFLCAYAFTGRSGSVADAAVRPAWFVFVLCAVWLCLAFALFLRLRSSGRLWPAIVSLFGGLIIVSGLIASSFSPVYRLLLVDGVPSKTAVYGKKSVALPFAALLKDVRAEYYNNSELQKNYYASVALMDKSGKPVSAVIAPGRPLRYDGYRVSIVRYGYNPGRRVVFTVAAGAGKNLRPMRVGFGQLFPVPGTELRAEITDFAPSLGQENGKIINFKQFMLNPAILVSLYDADGSNLGSRWIFMNYPESGSLGVFSVIFGSVEGVRYAAFDVARDRGVYIAAFGAAVLFCGLLWMAFLYLQKKDDDGDAA